MTSSTFAILIKQSNFLGILLSKAQRDEILKTRDCVIGGKIAVCFEEEAIFYSALSQNRYGEKIQRDVPKSTHSFQNSPLPLCLTY